METREFLRTREDIVLHSARCSAFLFSLFSLVSSPCAHAETALQPLPDSSIRTETSIAAVDIDAEEEDPHFLPNPGICQNVVPRATCELSSQVTSLRVAMTFDEGLFTDGVCQHTVQLTPKVICGVSANATQVDACPSGCHLPTPQDENQPILPQHFCRAELQESVLNAKSDVLTFDINQQLKFRTLGLCRPISKDVADIYYERWLTRNQDALLRRAQTEVCDEWLNRSFPASSRPGTWQAELVACEDGEIN